MGFDLHNLLKRRVLIADTDATYAEELSQILTGMEFECFTAPSDLKGFKVFLEKGPDVVVVDTLLPRKGGFELVERIRNAHGGGDAAVFFTSAFSSTSKLNAEMMETLGARGVLNKPAKTDAVQEIFRKFAPKKRSAEKAPRRYELYCGETPHNLRCEQPDLPGIIAGIVDRRESCRLALGDGKVKKLLYFKEGRLEFCSSNLISETLGRHLYNKGLIDEDSYRKAIEVMLEEKRRMGEILVEMGATDEETINRSIGDNVLEKFHDVFNWRRATLRELTYQPSPVTMPLGSATGPELLWEIYRDKVTDRAVVKLMEPYRKMAPCLARGVDSWETEIEDPELRGQVSSWAAHLDGKELDEISAQLEETRPLRAALYLLARRHMNFNCANDGSGELSPDELTIKVEQEKKLLHRLKPFNAFQLLGIGLEADDEEVRANYHKLAARYHPDSADSNGSQELTQVNSELFILINEAYTAIEDGHKRAKYLQRIENEAAYSSAEDTLTAEAEFMEGMTHFRKRAWPKAVDKFKSAVKKNPQEPDYNLHLGLAILRSGAPTQQKAQEDAEQRFKEAHQLNPHFAKPLFEIAKIANLNGDQERAVTYLVRALRRAPKDPDIMRELRLIQSRGNRKVKKLIATLLGKKN